MKNTPKSVVEVQTYDLELDGKSYKYHRWVDGIDGRLLETEVEPRDGTTLSAKKETELAELLEEMVAE